MRISSYGDLSIDFWFYIVLTKNAQTVLFKTQSSKMGIFRVEAVLFCN